MQGVRLYRLVFVVVLVIVLLALAWRIYDDGRLGQTSLPPIQLIHRPDVKTQRFFRLRPAFETKRFVFELPARERLTITDSHRIVQYEFELEQAVLAEDPMHGAAGNIICTAYAVCRNGDRWERGFGPGSWWFSFSRGFRRLFNEDAAKQGLVFRL